MRARELNFNYQRCHLKGLKKTFKKEKVVHLRHCNHAPNSSLTVHNHLMEVFKPVFCGLLEASLRIPVVSLIFIIIVWQDYFLNVNFIE